MTFEVRQGDCVEAMAAMPAGSVDSVVCDPPYGLEFMGRGWDRFDGASIDPAFGHWLAGFIDGEGCFHIHRKPQGTFDCQFSISLRGDDMPILERCHKQTGLGTLAMSRRDGNPQGRWTVSSKAACVALRDLLRAFPLRAKKAHDFELWSDAVDEWVAHERGEWDSMEEIRAVLMDSRAYVDGGVRVDPFQMWCWRWGREALRVLKPGGHCLSFGGTRTVHRLTAGLEDAGFEIRDTICWLYGSGFPKSLDVSKAIDKLDAAAERDGRAKRSQGWLREYLTPQQVDRATGTNMGHHLTTHPSQPFVPTPAMLDQLRPLLPEVPDWLERLVGDRAVESENMKRREVTGERDGTTMPGFAKIANGEPTSWEETLPHTADARRWEGWGTALKPSNEPVVVARKPRSESDILAEIGSWLATLEAWLAQGADPTTPTGAEGASPVQTDTSSSGSMVTTFSSTVTSWRKCWAELWKAASTSTTSTGSGTTTGLRTLWSSLLGITRESITPARMQADGWRSLVEAVDTLFAAAVLSSRATHALSVHESATGNTLTCSPDEDDGTSHRRPAHEPVVVARKPLSGTVAATVLEHGTGGLNVDGCRVGDTVETWPASRNYSAKEMSRPGSTQSDDAETQATGPMPAGRWPANVVLDEQAARLLDEQTGERRSAGVYDCGPAAADTSSFGLEYEWGEENPKAMYADSGGASRFFPTFDTRYEEAECSDDGSVEGATSGGATGPPRPVPSGATGTPERFRYVAKASRGERGAGLNGATEGHGKICTCPAPETPMEPEPPRDTCEDTATGASDSSTIGSGSRNTDRSPTDTRSTTSMETEPTTGSTTLSSCQPSTTSGPTPPTSDATTRASGSDAAGSAASGSPPTPSTTTSAVKAGHSTADADPATSGSSSQPNSYTVCSSCGGVVQGALRNSHPT